jgi:hypothetical protein
MPGGGKRSASIVAKDKPAKKSKKSKGGGKSGGKGAGKGPKNDRTRRKGRKGQDSDEIALVSDEEESSASDETSEEEEDEEDEGEEQPGPHADIQDEINDLEENDENVLTQRGLDHPGLASTANTPASTLTLDLAAHRQGLLAKPQSRPM